MIGFDLRVGSLFALRGIRLSGVYYAFGNMWGQTESAWAQPILLASQVFKSLLREFAHHQPDVVPSPEETQILSLRPQGR